MIAVSTAPSRRAMTLIEMLIAMTMSLIIMGVVAQLFNLLGRSVTDNQSVLTMKEQLRGVAQQLRCDLGGITVTTLPPVRPEADAGYLEIIEGAATDISSGTGSLNGDCDDVLMFTTKSLGKPFTGLFNGSSIESQYAEVAWFCVPAPLSQQSLAGYGTTLYTLYRRQLLSMAYVGAGAFQAKNSLAITSPSWTWNDFYKSYDLSCRYEISTSGTNLFPNSLGDLSKRENRFMHYFPGVSTFPFPFAGGTASGATLTAPREGSDIILTNVVGFDVRVYDPSVQIRSQSGSVGLVPDDPGYTGATVTGTGGYVNIGWGAGSPLAVGSTFPSGGQTAFQSAGVLVSNSSNNIALAVPTYDTWSLHYEFNGINEDNDNLTDEGTDGQDDDGTGVKNGIIDDPLEAETSAPYPVPLRGLEVRIRCYEPSSRQVRQVTVRHTFVPH